MGILGKSGSVQARNVSTALTKSVINGVVSVQFPRRLMADSLAHRLGSPPNAHGRSPKVRWSHLFRVDCRSDNLRELNATKLTIIILFELEVLSILDHYILYGRYHTDRAPAMAPPIPDSMSLGWLDGVTFESLVDYHLSFG